ncbi:MAG: hypothetical protein ACF788_06085, partial [Novipirellula sp. JB048]
MPEPESSPAAGHEPQREHEVHAGHELEDGMLARVREWIDLFAWLRLLRTLRIAGSPSMIVIAMLTLAVWSPIFHWIGGDGSAAIDRVTPPHSSLPHSSLPHSSLPDSSLPDSPTDAELLSSAAGAVSLTAGALDFNGSPAVELPTAAGGFTRLLGSVLWTVVVWSCGSLVLLRQGALLTAGRSMASLKEIVRFAVTRSPAAWGASIVPL